MKRVGIIAALPGELKPLVQGWQPLTVARKGEGGWVSRVDDVECVAVYAGVGSQAAGRACEIAQSGATGQSGATAQSQALHALFSVGWAGALSCGIHPGSAYAVNEVVDAQTEETFVTSFPVNREIGVPFKLVTTDHIVQYAEKRQLAGRHKALLVDMEAAAVARFARSRQVPFYCLKAISDEISDILPDFSRYTGADGHLRIAPLLGHVAFRPKYWPAMLRMGQNAKSGARAVAGALAPLMIEA